MNATDKSVWVQRIRIGEPSREERLLHVYAKAPEAFWRHDIDLSLAAAVRMAQVGQLAGVHSTYFVRPDAEVYNAFSREASHHLNAIRSMGHRLGVHVNANDRDPRHAIDHAQRLFHSAYPDLFDLGAVSFHMPSSDLLWRHFDGVDSAYGPQWQDRYISDSRGEWTEKKESLVANDMQVALHPEWWCS